MEKFGSPQGPKKLDWPSLPTVFGNSLCHQKLCPVVRLLSFFFFFCSSPPARNRVRPAESGVEEGSPVQKIYIPSIPIVNGAAAGYYLKKKEVSVLYPLVLPSPSPCWAAQVLVTARPKPFDGNFFQRGALNYIALPRWEVQ